MNLHGIAAGAVAAVNPPQMGSVRVSAGYTTNPDGTRTPAYLAPVSVPIQIQAMTYSDLRQTDGLNLNGTRRAMYLFGDIEGIVRDQNKGGDLITLPDGSVWLVALVLEQFGAGPDWTKVAVTRQDGS